MTIRDFYIERIYKILELDSSISFSVKFFYELGRAESNIAVKIVDCDQSCFEKLSTSKEFLNLHLSDNGMLTWTVPNVIWFKHLIILSDKLELSDIAADSLNLNEDDLFELRYIYTRICSVFRHYNKKISGNSLYSVHKANLHLISRQDIIGLVRTMVAFTLLDLKRRNQVNMYVRKLIKSFNRSWDSSSAHEELAFITLENIPETKSRLAVLDVLKRMLLKFFEILDIKAQEELG